MNNTSSIADDKVFFQLFDLFSPLSKFEWFTMLTIFPTLVFLYLLVLFVVYKNKSGDFRNPYYVFLLANGICDLAMLIYTVYSVLLDTVQNRVLGNFMDNVISFVFYWALGWYGTQIFSAMIATNRFFAIVFHNRYALYTVEHARILTLFGFVVSMAIPLPIITHNRFKYMALFKV